MKKKTLISLGPGAPSLILIFVILSLSILGMLSLMTARSDRKLSERTAEVIRAVYSLNNLAEEKVWELNDTVQTLAEGNPSEEEFLKALPDRVPEGMELEDGCLFWQETDESRVLDCAVKVTWEDGKAGIVWVKHSLTTTIADNMDMFDD